MAKAPEFADKLIAVKEYRNFTYKEGTTIAGYVNLHLAARHKVYIVIMKLKEH